MSPHTPPRRTVGWVDVVIVGVVLAAIGYLYYRVDTVLEYNWSWSFIPSYLVRWDEEERRWAANIILKGLNATLRLAVWSMLIAAVIGVVMGVMRTSARLLPRLISRTYVELVRNVPPLVFIFIFYFFISGQIMPLLGVSEFVASLSPAEQQWLGWLFGPPELFENVLSGIICLALFEGAYITEIVRAGLQAVAKSQYEAGLSIGLGRLQLLRYIVLPQAMQKVIPPLANQFITLIKDSSIVSLISVQELTFVGTEVAVSTSRVFETWITVAALYFVICYTLSRLFARWERRSSASRQ